MEFVQMKAEHAAMIRGFEAIHAGSDMTPDVAVELEAIGAVSAIDRGEVLAVAGILPRWHGVGLAWAWLGREWRREARAITERVAQELDASPYHRIEAGVRVGYGRGHRWMERLGFALETPIARGWGPDGGDYSIYVRLRHG
ncbi:MAG: hypothetical protein ACRCSU_07330 [Paracoccaceae bacterium]